MRVAFAILAVTNVALLCVTALVGLMVEGERHYVQHFLLGLLAALFTCLVHVIAFTVFIVSGRIGQEAVLSGAADRSLQLEIQRGKSAVLRLAMLGIVWTLATAALGAIVTEPGQAAAWGVSTHWHLVAGLAMIPVNMLAFSGEFAAIGRNARLFDRAFSPAGNVPTADG